MSKEHGELTMTSQQRVGERLEDPQSLLARMVEDVHARVAGGEDADAATAAVWSERARQLGKRDLAALVELGRSCNPGKFTTKQDSGAAAFGFIETVRIANNGESS